MLFTFDDIGDRDRASDGVSRYGAYLRRNVNRFDWDEPVTTDPAQFARAAWEVATCPIMAPPYLGWTAERIQEVTFTVSQAGALIAAVRVAVPRPEALRVVRGFGEWERGTGYERGYWPPEEDALALGPAMLTSTVLVWSIPPEELHIPQVAPAPLTDEAKASVRKLAVAVDKRLAPVLNALGE